MELNRRSLLSLVLGGVVLTACSSPKDDNPAAKDGSAFQAGPQGKKPLRILAGSEQKALEPLIKEHGEKAGVNIHITYLGSLDIMHELRGGAKNYDALMPASSMWLTMGDDKKVLKHMRSTAITPVVFGIRESKAKALGYHSGGEVSMEQLIEAIRGKKFSFAMTSASQSNSGASAYLGFLSALAKNPNGLSSADLKNSQLRSNITSLLSGVNRFSGSSSWLMDLLLSSDYDAMVNYETIILQTNEKLKAQGKEPLAVLYPKDGLTFSDAPLVYVDHGDGDLESAFLALQDFLLSPEAQSFMERSGKRNAFGKVSPENAGVFTKWGVDLRRTLTPIKLPSSSVTMEAIALYQTAFKKPALTVYVLDYSGSMKGERFDTMKEALSQVMVPSNAEKSLLKGTPGDLTLAFPFCGSMTDKMLTAHGNAGELEGMYNSLMDLPTDGGTPLYETIARALEQLHGYGAKLRDYTPAIVVLSDGEANGGMRLEELQEKYEAVRGDDVPIFGILFGNSDDSSLEKLASMSGGRVFDGKGDLTRAFKEVKGYN